MVGVAGVSEHIALPIRVGGNGGFVTVAEDSAQEIVQNVAVLLRTREGERLATPEFGTPDPVFTGLDAEAALALIATTEPRATVEVVRQVLDRDGRQVTDLDVRRREST